MSKDTTGDYEECCWCMDTFHLFAGVPGVFSKAQHPTVEDGEGDGVYEEFRGSFLPVDLQTCSIAAVRSGWQR